MNFNYLIKQKGFHLIELLIVLAIITILATIVIWFLRPSIYLNRAKAARISHDSKTISDATMQYYIYSKNWPSPELNSELKPICDTNRLIDNELNCSFEEINLSKLVPNFVTAIPLHPNSHRGDRYGIKLVNGKPIVDTIFHSK